MSKNENEPSVLVSEFFFSHFKASQLYWHKFEIKKSYNLQYQICDVEITGKNERNVWSFKEFGDVST